MHSLCRIALVVLSLLAATAHAEICVFKDRVTGADDGIHLAIAPAAVSVEAVACHVDGVATAPIPTIAILDRAGNTISLTGTLTCSSTPASVSTWVTTNLADADRDLILGEGLVFNVTNTPGSFDRVTVCVRFE